MLYFAYGSNLNQRHLLHWLASCDLNGLAVGRPIRAVLHDYRLRTNVFSVTHSAGACNIEKAKGEEVEGAIIEVNETAWEGLCRKEGSPFCYCELPVHVSIPRRKKMIEATTFIVVASRRLKYDLPTTDEYRSLVLHGAKEIGLTKTYQKMLNRLLIALPPMKTLRKLA